MKICSWCKKQNQESFTYCIYCGRELRDEARVEKGNSNDNNSKDIALWNVISGFGNFIRLIIFIPVLFFGLIGLLYFLGEGDLGEGFSFLFFILLFFGATSVVLKVIDKVPKTTSKPNYNYSASYPSNWNELREEAKKHDGYKCGNCGSTTNLHVHHIVPLSKGGSNQLSNLRTLCEDCHKKLHPHMK